MNAIFHRRPKRNGIITFRRLTRISALTLVELLVVLAIIVVLFALLIPARRSAREPARRNQCLSQMKQIALAMLNYEAAHGTLPPAYTTDADGKPLHSWRTLILPYMEYGSLYESIDLTKPWDDPVNAAALNTHIDAYKCPSSPSPLDNRTTYLAIVTQTSAIRSGKSRSIAEIGNAAGKTLIVIEVGIEQSVPWISPVDADEKFALSVPAKISRTGHDRVFTAAFADAHAEAIRDDIDVDQLRALISLGGKAKEATETAE